MLALAFSLVLQTKSNWNALDETVTGRNGAHSFRIAIHCANFEPRGRQVGWAKVRDQFYPAINGRRTWVCDGWSPDEIKKENAASYLLKNTIEIRKFEVTVDGHRRPVPQSLYFDLLNLDLNWQSPNDMHGVAWLSKDGRRLVLKQDGSDGGGGYYAYFVFDSGGHIERRIYIDNILVDRRTN